MCYRCQVCGTVVHGKLRKHVVQRVLPRQTYIKVYEEDFRGQLRETYRPAEASNRTEIEREVPVCGSCQDYLRLGIPLAQLQAQGGRPILFMEVGNGGSSKKRQKFASLAERLGFDMHELVEAVGTAG